MNSNEALMPPAILCGWCCVEGGLEEVGSPDPGQSREATCWEGKEEEEEAGED